MRNCLILGSGRSGTSMVAGTLAQAGYFMGDHLYPPRESNPKGFFEDPEINGINEALLAQVLPNRPWLIGRWLISKHPRRGQRWLARVPFGTEIPCTPKLSERIRKATQREPYCFKDPRFSYTLPAWRPFLQNVAYVCVFRDPGGTASSMLKECADAPYLRSLSINFDEALDVWTLMHRNILQIHRHEGDWLFLHYNQLLTGEALGRLEAFTSAPVDRAFPDPSLQRSSSDLPVPREAATQYQLLCRLAGYEEP